MIYEAYQRFRSSVFERFKNEPLKEHQIAVLIESIKIGIVSCEDKEVNWIVKFESEDERLKVMNEFCVLVLVFLHACI